MKKKIEKEGTGVRIIEGIVGLNGFMNTFKNNETIPLIYHGNGLVPLDSPFSTMVIERDMILESDRELVNQMIDKKDYIMLTKFIKHRRRSVENQFIQRSIFMSRSLAFNLHCMIVERINESIGPNIPILDNCIIDRVGNTIQNHTMRYVGIQDNPTMLDTDVQRDMITTYSYNSSDVIDIVGIVYNIYDSEVMYKVSGMEDPEKIYLTVMKSIGEYFDTFKVKLDWLYKSLRYEANVIYKPMMLDEYNYIEEVASYMKKDKMKFKGDDYDDDITWTW